MRGVSATALYDRILLLYICPRKTFIEKVEKKKITLCVLYSVCI